ncbi:MAG: helix-turn-helix transcriptional regulator [Bacteroidetes bacterium]|nr:helix-turn-helix transcriptional regulator [Bacteroidota bacterium]
MVCPRCIMAVENALTKLEINYKNVSLGEVQLVVPLDSEMESKLSYALINLGFEILSNKKSQLIEKIRSVIIILVHHQEDPEKIGRLSEKLPGILGQSYSSLSKLFSEVEGITIEKYFINQKIEKAKELLRYEELNISEIAYRLNYSSSQHFSRQFKSITGLSPSSFNKYKKAKRKHINEI